MGAGDVETSVGSPIVLFDAVCPLCTRSARFIARNDQAHQFRFAALQSPVGRELTRRVGLPEADVAAASLVLLSDGQWFRSSAAVLEIAAALGRPWSWFAPLRHLPFGLREWVYGVVANHRPRGVTACVLGRDLDRRMLPDGNVV
ncbi:MAG: DUF393 domain-containing protein [Gemmatimonadales bacterium]|nr:MAG: DUF393 domain-containing protein [Gemmatimonadales bacterium]